MRFKLLSIMILIILVPSLMRLQDITVVAEESIVKEHPRLFFTKSDIT